MEQNIRGMKLQRIHNLTSTESNCRTTRKCKEGGTALIKELYKLISVI